jgi:ABC-type nitrate/sulfonate/bicarbonate transport system substrate-binding protein/outer membrane protein OmpA-like peptidoglycan-associated protein
MLLGKKMKPTSKFWPFLALSIFLSSSVWAGFAPVQQPPLKSVVSSQVGEVVDQGTLKVPIITWGGDIPTVYANGNSRKTAPNSCFAQKGLNIELQREDVFVNQVAAYMSGKTPFLRGTLGMINMAAEVTDADPRTRMQVIYQLTWSNNGDAIVVKSNIKTPSDLKGKTIALQAYGPHLDYLSKILRDAGLSINEVKLVYTKDLTGTDNSPAEAFAQQNIDAAMVIIPDALALTSNGSIGSGAEGSIKGAKILLTTKMANKIIADVYAVRSDYLAKNKAKVQSFVQALMKAQEEVAELTKQKESQLGLYNKMISAAADFLLDSPGAIADTEGMYADADFVGFKGNLKFFTDVNYPRNFDNLCIEIQDAFLKLGMLSQKVVIENAVWDYNGFKAELKNTQLAETPKFDSKKVSQAIENLNRTGNLNDSELFSFKINFQPNQNDFTADMYAKEFDEAIDKASTYGGAIVTIEGHSDPLKYLKLKKENANEIVLRQTIQSNKNLSYSRASKVMDSLIEYAKGKGITLDRSQFTAIGQGFSKPTSGVDSSGEPLPPKSKQAWLDNMRVEFRIIKIQAEETQFEMIE